MVPRRVYYDHEPVYRRVLQRGGSGWDDRRDDPDTDSYLGLDAFIAEYCRGRAIASVLDLGCGGGQAGLRFVDLAGRVLGVDYSESAVELARRNAAGMPQASFEVADLTNLDGVTGTFDVIIDNHALHCLVDDEHRAGMLSAVARLLSSDGLFFCETMSREGRFDAAIMGAEAPTFVDSAKTRRWVSRQELDDELAAAGLEATERRSRPPDGEDPPCGDLLWTVARQRS